MNLRFARAARGSSGGVFQVWTVPICLLVVSGTRIFPSCLFPLFLFSAYEEIPQSVWDTIRTLPGEWESPRFGKPSPKISLGAKFAGKLCARFSERFEICFAGNVRATKENDNVPQELPSHMSDDLDSTCGQT